MAEKEELKKAAKIHREAAEILEEMAENTDEDKEDELAVRYALKHARLQKLLGLE